MQSIGGANGFDACEVVGVDWAKKGDGKARWEVSTAARGVVAVPVCELIAERVVVELTVNCLLPPEEAG